MVSSVWTMTCDIRVLNFSSSMAEILDLNRVFDAKKIFFFLQFHREPYVTCDRRDISDFVDFGTVVTCDRRIE